MKRFICFMILIVSLCSLVACLENDATPIIEQPTHAEASQRIGNFIIIKTERSDIEYEYDGYTYWQRYVSHLVYDEDTKVMYSILHELYDEGSMTITMLYNPDGTPRIFSEE